MSFQPTGTSLLLVHGRVLSARPPSGLRAPSTKPKGRAFQTLPRAPQTTTTTLKKAHATS
eukprot:4754029-Pleurochrysis_carterae.AAC.1